MKRNQIVSICLFIGLCSIDSICAQVPFQGVVTSKNHNTRTSSTRTKTYYFGQEKYRIDSDLKRSEFNHDISIALLTDRWSKGCYMILSPDFNSKEFVLKCKDEAESIPWERIYENPVDTVINGYRCQQVVYRVHLYDEYIDFMLDTVYYSQEHHLMPPKNLDQYSQTIRSDDNRLPIAVVSWTYMSMALKGMIENFASYTQVESIEPKTLDDTLFDQDIILKETKIKYKD